MKMLMHSMLQLLQNFHARLDLQSLKLLYLRTYSVVCTVLVLQANLIPVNLYTLEQAYVYRYGTFKQRMETH